MFSRNLQQQNLILHCPSSEHARRIRLVFLIEFESHLHGAHSILVLLTGVGFEDSDICCSRGILEGIVEGLSDNEQTHQRK
jgi:hypothetical protein